jgi:hypothetical protein
MHNFNVLITDTDGQSSTNDALNLIRINTAIDVDGLTREDIHAILSLKHGEEYNLPVHFGFLIIKRID